MDRLFLGQRTRAWSRACFREIGDFVAHRDTREKGLLYDRTSDAITLAEVERIKI